MNKEEEIFDLYVRECRIESISYKLMGKLLEKEHIRERIELYKIDSLYIYGGGYLGIQLYNAVCDMVDVKGVVDKNGGLSVDVKDVRAISLEDLKNEYTEEKIIITPVKYYQAIKNDLLQFVKQDNILFLGEFLEGIVS